MKRKIFLLLSLLFMVIPLSGCGEDVDPATLVTVTTEINPPANMLETAEVTYDINDCARISEGGVFTKGSKVTVTVDVLDTCKVSDWLINGVSSGKNSTTLSLEGNDTNINSLNIQAIIESKTTASGSISFLYEGIYTKDGTRVDQGTTIEFPRIGENAKDPVNPLGNIKQGMMLSRVMIGVNSNSGKKANLNYVYENDMFVAYMLRWQIGTYNNGFCNFNNSSYLDDPNTYAINGNTCVRAILDTTATSLNESKIRALDNFLKSEAYVYKNSTYCQNDTNGTANVNANCFYVSKLQNLYPDVNGENPSDAGHYFGYNNSQLEAVQTTTDNTKLLYKCTAQARPSSGICGSEYSYKVNYLSEGLGYEKLAISDFIEKIKEESQKETNRYSGIGVQFGYDYHSGDIKVTSIDLDGDGSFDYDINILKPNTYYNSPTDKFSSPKEAKLYTITVDESAGDFKEGLEAAINEMDVFDRIDTTDNIKERIKTYLYNRIKSDNSIKELINYIMTLSEDSLNAIITINFQKAIADTNLLDTYNMKEITSLTSETIRCSSTNENCSNSTTVGIIENFSRLVMNGDGFVGSNYTIDDITIDNDKITYKFQYNGTSYEIRYEREYKSSSVVAHIFTIGDISVKYFTETAKKAFVTKIVSTNNSVFGVITQTLDDTGNITTKVGDTVTESIVVGDKTIEIDKAKIMALKSKFDDKDIYIFDDGNCCLIVTNEGTIQLMKDKDGNPNSYIYIDNANYIKYVITFNIK